MDERAIRAHLALMNMSAPFGYVWVAEDFVLSEFHKHYEIHQHLRFWCVPDNSETAHAPNMIKA